MKKIKVIKVIAVVLLLVSLFCTLDLGLNYVYNLEWQAHDGLTAHSTLHGLFGIFGDSLWSLDLFYSAFEISAWVTFGALVAAVAVSFRKAKEI